MIGVIMNPGTGPLSGTTKRRAVSNMKAFMRDLGLNKATCDYAPSRAYEGRWDFRLYLGRKRVEVSMPGCPIADIRDNKSPWTPRLYVDGSSWYWPFALEIVREEFGPKEKEERS